MTKSLLAWLTPDASQLAESQDKRAMCLPGSLWYLVAGALLPLARPENWEEYGTATPDETAEYFQAVIDEFSYGGCGMASLNYKEYAAIMLQSGTSPPSPTVVSNTLGVTVTWSRTTAGFYSFMVPAGTLPVGKVIMWCSIGDASNKRAYLFYVGSASVSVVSTLNGVPSDGVLTGGIHMVLRVYD
jgi:hypothetical protein